MSASCCSCTVSSTSMRCWLGERGPAGKLLCASSKHTTHGDTRSATCNGDGVWHSKYSALSYGRTLIGLSCSSLQKSCACALSSVCMRHLRQE
jgi:hypothetical protein